MFTDLQHMLEERATDNKGIIYISVNNNDKYVSYRELRDVALKILFNFQSAGMKKGDELVFQIEENESFHSVYWACVLGGIIPVPISIGNNDEHNMKLFRVWDVLNNPFIVMPQERLHSLRKFTEQRDLHEQMEGMEQKTLLLENVLVLRQAGEIVKAQPNDLALIQFSSGSTGDPKGVMMTHETLRMSLKMMDHSLALEENDTMLGWQPMTHDLGIVGTHLLPIYGNITQMSMQTSLFAKRPLLWFEKANEHRANILWTTNYAIQFFLNRLVRKPELANGWDLSCIKGILCGAEPISPDLEIEFLDTLEPYGLKRTAFLNGYGMAETGLIVTLMKLSDEVAPVYVNRKCLTVGDEVQEIEDGNDPNVIRLVECGGALEGIQVRICDDNGQTLGENRVGHIQIDGPCCTKGYYNNPKKTRDLYTEDGWMTTGDIGFLRNGQLVITGRAKEMIIIQGQNYYPHDLERVAMEVEGVNRGVVVCGVYNDEMKEEEIVVFPVVREKLGQGFLDMAAQIKTHIAQKVGLPVLDVVPIKSIPKTTSGKIQHVRLSEMYRDGEFADVIAEIKNIGSQDKVDSRSAKSIENRLKEICKEIFGLPEIGMHENFKELGINSALVQKLHAELEKEIPGKLVVSDIFEHPTVHKLAQFISQLGDQQTNNFVPVNQNRNIKKDVHHLIQQMESGNLTSEELVAKLRNL